MTTNEEERIFKMVREGKISDSEAAEMLQAFRKIEGTTLDPKIAMMAETKSIFIKWEKLRLVYNIILLTVTIVFLGNEVLSMFSKPLFIAYCAAACFGANVLFFLGPIADSYAAFLRFRTRLIGTVIFILGSLFSILLTIITLQNYHYISDLF